MPKLDIDFDPAVIAHLVSAREGDTISISISVKKKEEAAISPDPAASKPRGPLAPLMKVGWIKAGDELYFHQSRADRTGRATVLADGKLVVEGQPLPFSSPSDAAMSVTGSNINGWTLWHLRSEDGFNPTLAELRKRLEAEEKLLYESTVTPAVDPSL